MKRVHSLLAFALLLAAAGCASHGSGGTSTQSSAASESTAVAETASPETPAQGPSPGATVTPSPDPNVLSVANGTILRSYSPASLDRINDGNLGNVAEGFGVEISSDTKPPFIFTFELPGMTKITSFSASLGEPADSKSTGTMQIETSASGPDSGFTTVGTLQRGADGKSADLTANVEARWVRVTANAVFSSVTALGTLAAPPAHLDPTGTYVVQAVPDANGAFVMDGTRDDLDQARFVSAGSGLTGSYCRASGPIAPFVGQVDGRVWNATFAGNKDMNAASVHAVVNDDASIIAGTLDGGSQSVVFMRTSKPLAGCAPRTTGTGSHRVLVLDQDPIPVFYPTDANPPLPGYAFDAIGAGMIDEQTLARYDTVVARGVCKMTDVVGPQQLALLLKWAGANGHKLILAGAGCESGADFTWLPYAFTTAGPGPESTNASLIQVEDDALGTNDKNDDPHFIDTLAYVRAQNALAATRPVTTTDTHWCGHLFVAKTTNLNGFVQTYANDGGGFLLYDGFDTSDDGNPQLQKVRRLELALPVPAALPCSQQATAAFLIEPSQEATFKAGTAQTISRSVDLLANQGWNGHVSVKADGPYPATVTPASFDVAGGVVHLNVSIRVPANAQAGLTTTTISADNGAGKSATATINLTGIAPLKKAALAPHQRIRIYGIHFDYDSARIQPVSEPVIADLASLMRANPAWRFEVSGHTDSDGGAAYNLALSQRRAQSVVNDLVTRYGIARSRLAAKGYGLSRPVASNATSGGKALNRRVELERLQ
jgi:outer membrane protein OmpA-like peptidoglycan-associated protein